MEASNTNKLILKSVNELLEYGFYIPSYQRGYRWTHTQVIQLLEDLWWFAENPPTPESGKTKPFYCLQPIVVKKYNDNDWEVIDGQQRLTSIFLIIHYFNEMWVGKQKIKEPIISYETRKTSKEFLSSIEIDSDLEVDLGKNTIDAIESILVNCKHNAQENIDFAHITLAYKSIHYWVKMKGNMLDNNKFQSVFQNDTKVIWYEIEETEGTDSIDIFTRLNIGKIPLTNSELIKALFLQKGNFSEEKATLKQIQIASEWDLIERALQDDAFWFFIYNINNPIKYDNRIEYVFDLMKDKTKDSEYYHTFNEFYKDFADNSKDNKFDIEKIWLNIKKYFLAFDEWYKDYELFHYIGFLIDSGIPINTIKKKSDNEPKDTFKNNFLRNEIKKQVRCNIDEIEYGDNKIKKVLLLFNIITVLQTQKSDMRFPFHKYKSENWDIEHICSQTDRTVNSKKRHSWINDMLDFFGFSSSISDEENFCEPFDDNDVVKNEIINTLINLKAEENIDENEFENIFKTVQRYFKEENQIGERDSISNLALLDSTTNRSYGNSFFPLKRERIIENDSKGIFVPIATKNVFLKYYSKKKMDNVMYWSEEDANCYLAAIKSLLENYLPKEGKNE